ncbi:hypothetical protein [Paraburkholderia sp. J12]|uniref:hypothetical protein n=1 Tax=Paraburkholderia sp. J12 TaxID=2805432 RepID=UPI002ABD6E32|nr:hypothetical protein [Paraburkholderia sp. J12]
MPISYIKRVVKWAIPAALIFMAIQYHDSGKFSVYAVPKILVAFILAGVVAEALDSWWKRTFGTSTAAVAVSALFWSCTAIGLFVFFYQMR